MNPDSGVYALLIHARTPQRIAIGALGPHEFPPGFYVYIGSAKVGLHSRIARHCRRSKPLHWHIDYLLAYARPVAVATFDWRRGAECRLARLAGARHAAHGLVPGFGSSDCSCSAHLFRLCQEPGDCWVDQAFGRLPAALCRYHVTRFSP